MALPVSLPHSSFMPHSRESFEEVDTVTTFAGSIQGFKDARGEVAEFNSPIGICFNSNDDCFYICDFLNHVIRKMTLQGVVSTVAKVSAPFCVAIYHKENILIACCGNSIVKISFSGKTDILAGDIWENGYKDGVGTDARFKYLTGMTIDQQTGNIFVCDSLNHLIRIVTQKGEVSTLAGSSEGFKDGNGNKTQFSQPKEICFNKKDQSLLVCDYSNNCIRRISSIGHVSTVCKVRHPIAITAAGGKFMVISGNEIFQLVIKAEKSELRKLAGSGEEKIVDGRAIECSFGRPRGIAAHEPSNSCFITDIYAIRKMTFK